MCLRSVYDVCILPANTAPISDARVSRSLIQTLSPEREIPLIKLFVQELPDTPPLGQFSLSGAQVKVIATPASGT